MHLVGWTCIFLWLLPCIWNSAIGSDGIEEVYRYCTEYEIRGLGINYHIVYSNGLAALQGDKRELDINEALRCFLCATRSDTELKFDAYRQVGEIYLYHRSADYIGFAKYYFIKALQRRNHGGIQQQLEVDTLKKLLEVYLKEQLILTEKEKKENSIDMIQRNMIGVRFYEELIYIKSRRLSEIQQTSNTVSLDGTLNAEENENNRFYRVDYSHISLDTMNCDHLQQLLIGNEKNSLLLSYNHHVSTSSLVYTTHNIASYELFISKLSNMFISCRNEGTTKINEYTEEKDFFKSSTTIQELRKDLDWPQNKPIKILFDDINGDGVFGETVNGLVSALTSLGVPCKIISYVVPNDDALYILLFASDEAMKTKHYIYWNLEKNPAIARPDEKPALKSFANDYIETVVFPPMIIYNSLAIWDYSIHHLNAWNDLFTTFARTYYPTLPFRSREIHVNVVRPLVSPDLVQFAVVENEFMHDALLPIDIALFGNANPHRQAMYNKLGAMAQKHNLRVEFHRKLYGSQRDAIMDSAKIILNLGNHPIPHETGSYRRSAANIHRIMYPLARGKVVLSEYSGIEVDEVLFGDIVTFANSSNLEEVALELLQDVSKRREIEKKAIAFAKRELALSSGDDGCKFDESLMHMKSLSSIVSISNSLKNAKQKIAPILTAGGSAPPSSFVTEPTYIGPYDSYDEGIQCFFRRENINNYFDRYRSDTDCSTSIDNLSKYMDIYTLLEHIDQFDSTRKVERKEFRRESSEDSKQDIMEAVYKLKLSEALFIHETHMKNESIIKTLDQQIWYVGSGVLEDLVLYNDLNADDVVDVATVDIDWGILVVMKRLPSSPRIKKNDWGSFPYMKKIMMPVDVDRTISMLSVHELYDWMNAHGVRRSI